MTAAKKRLADTHRSRPTRADAVSNRLRVVNAAAEIFAEQGARATIPAVAERAGVGNATVYRSFPSKADLLAEMAALRLTRMEGVLQAACDSSDPAEAFPGLVVELFCQLRTDRLAGDLLHLAEMTSEVAAVRTRVDTLMQTMIDHAVRDGQARPDITWQDVSIFMLGVSSRLYELEISDLASWQRQGHRILKAIRP